MLIWVFGLLFCSNLLYLCAFAMKSTLTKWHSFHRVVVPIGPDSLTANNPYITVHGSLFALERSVELKSTCRLSTVLHPVTLLL